MRILAPAVYWLGAIVTLCSVPTGALAQSRIEEFHDPEYGYSFQYPADWQLRDLPEGEADRDIRAMLLGPNGSSVMAIVEKSEVKLSKQEFPSSEDLRKKVEALMSQTIEQIYKTVSKNIGAEAMTVGERRDLSNGVALKFYLSTLHKMAKAKPIVVAGIHAFPFGKDYAVSFLMSASWQGTPLKEQEVLTKVLNSFRLLGETPAAESAPAPQNGKSE